MGRTKKENLVDVPVEFGGISFGAETARLGVTISRDAMSLAAADLYLCGHRLTGQVKLTNGDEADGQKHLVDDLDHAVGGVFDIKAFNTKPKHFSAGLTFSINDIDPGELVKFAKGKGRLIVNAAAPLESDVAEEHEEEEEAAVA